MTNNTIPHDHHHHRLRPHHQEMDPLQALAVKPQAKRQARRRTHTSRRPYQERLLNMAEARREIVTALKIHRASTSTRQQQSMYQHHQEPPLQQLQQQQEEQQQAQMAFQDRRQAAVDEEASLEHTTSTMSYAAASFANNPLCNSPLAHWIAAGSYCSAPVLPCDLTPPELPLPTAAMGGLVDLEHYQGGLERLVRSLPAQPLGLNLSFQGFGVSVDDGGKDDCEDLFVGSLPLTTQPSPAASYSYSPPEIETATTQTCGHGSPSPALSATDAEKHSVFEFDAPSEAAASLVPVLDGGEMTMLQASAGETQGVEWSEAAAADVAAWWSKIFEGGQRAPPNAENVAAAAGLPAEWRWLCGDDAVLGEQAGAITGGKPSPDVLGTTMMRVDDGDGNYSCCYEGGRSDDGEDVALPCMDGIGDDTEEGWDGVMGNGPHALD